jgi:hypothetical protein
MAVEYWRTGHISIATVTRVTNHFTDGSYYFMFPFKTYMRRHILENWLPFITYGGILERPWPKIVYGIMLAAGLGKKQTIIEGD